MDALLINYFLKTMGTSAAQVSRELGVCQSNVSEVIHGKRKTPHIQEAIARALNKNVEDVFPNRKNGKKRKDEEMTKKKYNRKFGTWSNSSTHKT